MARQHAGVEDRDRHASALGDVPSGGGIDLGQMPFTAEVRVIGYQYRRDAPIQLGKFQMRVVRQLRQHCGLGGGGRQLDDVQIALADACRYAAMRLE